MKVGVMTYETFVNDHGIVRYSVEDKVDNQTVVIQVPEGFKFSLKPIQNPNRFDTMPLDRVTLSTVKDDEATKSLAWIPSTSPVTSTTASDINAQVGSLIVLIVIIFGLGFAIKSIWVLAREMYLESKADTALLKELKAESHDLTWKVSEKLSDMAFTYPNSFYMDKCSKLIEKSIMLPLRDKHIQLIEYKSLNRDMKDTLAVLESPSKKERIWPGEKHSALKLV